MTGERAERARLEADAEMRLVALRRRRNKCAVIGCMVELPDDRDVCHFHRRGRRG